MIEKKNNNLIPLKIIKKTIKKDFRKLENDFSP